MNFSDVKRWQVPKDGVLHEVRLVTDLSGNVLWPDVLVTDGSRNKIITSGGDYIKAVT
jgi:hypothetical protein